MFSVCSQPPPPTSPAWREPQTNNKGAHALTAQTPEKILLDGEMLDLCTEPLGHYFYFGGTQPDFAPRATSCWRSYIGTWEIRNGRLYLVGIDAKHRDRNPVKLEDIFPGYPERVFAHWFTGILRCPRGPMLAYEHMGYGSVFEEDILLYVKQGVLMSREVRTNDVTNDTDAWAE